MSKKICTKCEVEKVMEGNFHKDKSHKTGYMSNCISCRKIYSDANREIILEKQRTYREENKEKFLQYRIDNRERLLETSRQYRLNNVEKIKLIKKKYREKHHEKITKYRLDNKAEIYRKDNAARKLKYDNNPLYKLSCNARSAVFKSIKAGGFVMKGKVEDVLGCTYKELHDYLNKNKHGFVFGNRDLDIDHIVPMSTAKTKKRIIELNHYTNMQLLPQHYNRHVKKDKPFDKKDFKKWLKENKND